MSSVADDRNLPKFSGAALAEIYSKLRDEQGVSTLGLDPNEKSRARIAMSILMAADLGPVDPKSLETTARALLRVLSKNQLG